MNTIAIFTDGSSRGNPGRGGYGALCAYPDSKGVLHVDELGGREAVTTNNRMEIMGLIAALKNMEGYYAKGEPVTFKLYIDSAYVLNGAKEWLKGWKNKNWMTSTKEDVKNSDLWRELDTLLEKHKENGVKLEWNLIKGHAGTPGNERCDEIATGFADATDNESMADMLLSLYKGKLDEYPLGDIFFNNPTKQVANGTSASSASKSANKGKAAYSYVSFVDGQMHTDKTWAECEKRVKGKSGAKFKKSFSAADEAEIIAGFQA